MGWGFRDKRAENVWRDECERWGEGNQSGYTALKLRGALGRPNSNVNHLFPQQSQTTTFVFLLETWKCEVLWELHLRVTCTWEIDGVAEPDCQNWESFINCVSLIYVCFRCKSPNDLHCKKAGSEFFQIIFFMAYYGKILTIRYKSNLKIETVQVIGASRNTDFRWCLNESWSVGLQRLPETSLLLLSTLIK